MRKFRFFYKNRKQKTKDRRQKTGNNKQEISPFKIIIAALCLFFILYFFLKLFVIDMMVVKGRSMEPVFIPGDVIFINKLAYGLLIPFKNEYIIYWAYPEHNDIILIKEPEEGKLVVKRCIAIAGDPVDFKEGELFIAKKRIPYNPALHFSFDIHSGTVPENTIFVMGDNPGQSIDSRHFGYIHISSVYAKILTCKSPVKTIRKARE